MRIEERGYSMITDEQGREWLLQKLYDDGWRYYVKNAGGGLFLTTNKPVIFNGRMNITVGGRIRCADVIGKVLPSLNKNEILDIAEYLGIVDWSKVPVDTPIIVKYEGVKKPLNRHFSRFSNGNIYYFTDGKTSWTSMDETKINIKSVELAGGNDE